MLAGWEIALGQFAAAPQALLDQRELQRRTDSKFVMSQATAVELLKLLVRDYVVLIAGGGRSATYRTLYFDTRDLHFFHAHRRGRRVRHKVRIRHYPDRALSFLEVKTHINDAETLKTRRPRSYGSDGLTQSDLDFVYAQTEVDGEMAPQALTTYRRATLLGIESEERLTFDFDFSARVGERHVALPGAVIVEVKQPRANRWTSAMRAMSGIGVREGWASKYCVSIALARPEVSANRLLAGLRALKAVGA